MIKINLLSEGKRPVVARRAKQPIGGARADIGNALLVAGIVIGLLVAGGWWYMLDREIQKKDREIVLYCRSGARSALAAAALKDLGFDQPLSLAGGMIGWLAAGKPVEQ